MSRLIVVIACVMSVGCGLNIAPGEGEKIGQIVKLNREGIMCDTWEGQLIRGGMTGGSGAFGVQPFDFTITDSAMAGQAMDAMRNQKEIMVRYRIEGVYQLCRSGSGGHFLTSIEAAPSNER